MRWILMMTLCLAACATGGHRYYDNDYGDYHTWNGTEVVFYSQWETDTRRPHVEYERRPSEEQREYWKWRHEHVHDRDRDHDH